MLQGHPPQAVLSLVPSPTPSSPVPVPPMTLQLHPDPPSPSHRNPCLCPHTTTQLSTSRPQARTLFSWARLPLHGRFPLCPAESSSRKPAGPGSPTPVKGLQSLPGASSQWFSHLSCTRIPRVGVLWGAPRTCISPEFPGGTAAAGQRPQSGSHDSEHPFVFCPPSPSRGQGLHLSPVPELLRCELPTAFSEAGLARPS